MKCSYVDIVEKLIAEDGSERYKLKANWKLMVCHQTEIWEVKLFLAKEQNTVAEDSPYLKSFNDYFTRQFDDILDILYCNITHSHTFKTTIIVVLDSMKLVLDQSQNPNANFILNLNKLVS